jgi:hypothetical protein
MLFIHVVVALFNILLVPYLCPKIKLVLLNTYKEFVHDVYSSFIFGQQYVPCFCQRALHPMAYSMITKCSRMHVHLCHLDLNDYRYIHVICMLNFKIVWLILSECSAKTFQSPVMHVEIHLSCPFSEYQFWTLEHSHSATDCSMLTQLLNLVCSVDDWETFAEMTKCV